MKISAASATFICSQNHQALLRSEPLAEGRSIPEKKSTAKIWVDEQKQTIAFELPELRQEVFKIVIPELVSDSKEPIVPWEHPSPDWRIEENSAHWSTEIPGKARMKSEVQFGQDRILTRVSLTNLSKQSWEKTNAFTCFAFYAAPTFDDPELTRTYFPVNDNWKSVSVLFSEHNPGDGPYTFFPVVGGPQLSDLWLGRKIPQHHPQIVSRGCACVVSKDGNWIAGMSTRTPAYAFHNRKERCVHADPFLGTVPPDATIEGTSEIHIFRGSLADFMDRCRQT
jgi:hypothetical protein